MGNSLVVQCLGLGAFTAVGLDLIPGFDPWLGNKDPKLSGMAKKRLVGTSLASNAGGTVLMPGWGIRILHDAY